MASNKRREYNFVPGLMSAEQAGWYLGDMAPVKVRELRDKGILPSVKIGGSVKWPKEVLDRYIESLR
jgi:hypothetical protein